MNKNLILKLSVILAVLFVTACGNKGDLFIEDTASDQAQTEQEKTNN